MRFIKIICWSCAIVHSLSFIFSQGQLPMDNTLDNPAKGSHLALIHWKDLIWAFIFAAEFSSAAAIFYNTKQRKFPAYFFGFNFQATTQWTLIVRVKTSRIPKKFLFRFAGQ